MADEKNSKEIEKEMIEVLGSEQGKLFNSIQNEFILLGEKFKHFKELFMTDESRIQVMNKTAPFFFFSLQRILLDDLVMNISRLTESEMNRKFRNATLKGFIRSFDKERLSPEIFQYFNLCLKSVQCLNDWRDKRVAHRDFDIHVNNKVINLKYVEIENCMGGLTSLMKALYSHFFNSDFMYEFFSPTGGASSLLKHLDLSLRAKSEYFESLKSSREFNIEAIRPHSRSYK